MIKPHNRGLSILLATGMVFVMFLAASTLVMATARRYHNAQITRDRLQAVQCAQAGLLWAQSQTAPPASAEITLGDAGLARVTIASSARGTSIISEGIGLRDREPQASRRLERWITLGAPAS